MTKLKQIFHPDEIEVTQSDIDWADKRELNSLIVWGYDRSRFCPIGTAIKRTLGYSLSNKTAVNVELELLTVDEFVFQNSEKIQQWIEQRDDYIEHRTKIKPKPFKFKFSELEIVREQ